MRMINCSKCGAYLGQIRDATLAKGISYTCVKCQGADRVSSKLDSILFGERLKKFKKMTGIEL